MVEIYLNRIFNSEPADEMRLWQTYACVEHVGVNMTDLRAGIPLY